MKLLVLLSLIFSTNVFADQKLNLAEDYAKDERRELYILGHEDVDSSVEKPSLNFLKEELKGETQARYEGPLDSEEISSIFKCFYEKGCDVYFVNVSSSYHSGYGQYGLYLLITDDLKAQTISQTIYTE